MFLLSCQSQPALRPSGVCCPYWVVYWISMSPLSFTPSPPHLLPHHHRQVNLLAMFSRFHQSHMLHTQEPDYIQLFLDPCQCSPVFGLIPRPGETWEWVYFLPLLLFSYNTYRMRRQLWMNWWVVDLWPRMNFDLYHDYCAVPYISLSMLRTLWMPSSWL